MFLKDWDQELKFKNLYHGGTTLGSAYKCVQVSECGREAL